MNWAGSDVSKKTDVCADCAGSLPGLGGINNLDAVFNPAPCRYCGGQPFTAEPEPISLLSGIHKVSMMCKPCSEEYSRFLSQKWPGLGDPAITEGAVASIHEDTPEVIREAEEHMKKWVANRNSK